MTRARDAATNSHVATYVHPTGAGNQHVPAAGAAGQLLQYASAGTAAWATISTGTTEIVWPSDFASPNNTYTSSGTWSKGSLSDDDYVWIYLVGGGGGGGLGTNGYVQAGRGGTAKILYGKAGLFDGGAYVIGAGAAKGTPGATTPTESTFTLSSSNNSTVFTTGTFAYESDTFQIVEDKTSQITVVNVIVSAVVSQTSTFSFPSSYPTIPNAYAGESNAYAWNAGVNSAYNVSATNSVWGGGGGGAIYGSSAVTGGAASLYAADGSNFNAGGTAAVPGAGGCAGTSTSGQQAGGAGNLRVYHV